jgi:micrococcal nuclease
MFKKAIFLWCLVTSFAVASDLTVIPLEIVDGDTFKTNLIGLPDSLRKVSVRIKGIDTPEIKGKCLQEIEKAIEAKSKLKEIISDYSAITVKNVKWDKYGGRILGDVYLSNGNNVASEMISSGLARPYSGGSRTSWCK